MAGGPGEMVQAEGTARAQTWRWEPCWVRWRESRSPPPRPQPQWGKRSTPGKWELRGGRVETGRASRPWQRFRFYL